MLSSQPGTSSCALGWGQVRSAAHPLEPLREGSARSCPVGSRAGKVSSQSPAAAAGVKAGQPVWATSHHRFEVSHKCPEL